MKTPHYLTAFALRSPYSGHFTRGMIGGAVFCGILVFVFYYSLTWLAFPVRLFDSRAINHNEPFDIHELSQPELAFALAPFLTGKSALVIGSSETGASPPEFPVPVAVEVDACSGNREFLMPSPRGSAIQRAVILLERLQNYFDSQRPVSLVLIDNPHYSAFAQSSHWPDPQAYLGNPVHVSLHLSQTRDSILNESAVVKKRYRDTESAGFLKTRYLEWQALRLMLGRRIVLPIKQYAVAKARPVAKPVETSKLTQSKRNSVWEVEQRFVPEPGMFEQLRNQKAITDNLSSTVYGQYVRELGRRIRKTLPPGSSVTVLILPIHEVYFRRLGFSKAEILSMESMREQLFQESLEDKSEHKVTVRVATELSWPEYFYDSIHYNRQGRARLAQVICDELM